MKESKSSLVSCAKCLCGGISVLPLSFSSRSQDRHTVLHQTHNGKESTVQVSVEKSMFPNCGTEPQLLLNFPSLSSSPQSQMLNYSQESRQMRLKLCESSSFTINLLQEFTMYLETANTAQKTYEQAIWVPDSLSEK